MDPIGPGLLGRGHLLAQTGEVGGEERGANCTVGLLIENA